MMTLTDLAIRPTHCSHPVLEGIIREMRAQCRDEFVHYAGACHRDPIAWQMCREWVADPTATEAELKTRALAAYNDGLLVEATLADR